ncbi:MAG: ABC transporter ATP-binding protein [Caulobacteraceae bacterium]
MPLLTIDRLNVEIDSAPILKDVSLSLNEGEILGLVGESGSGKSMTALSVLGLLPPGAKASGRIRLQGEDLLTLSEAAMNRVRGARIGMIFQEPMTALNPLMTIGDQVAETFRTHGAASGGQAMKRAVEVLRRVELPPELVSPSRYPHELSGGQRQRVAVAMAVALKPALLIADEATTALDVTTQAQVLTLLRKLVSEDRMGLILVTHDLAVVAGTANRVAIMKDGAVVEQGETAEVLGSPAQPYTRALMDASAYAPPKRAAKPAGAPVLEVRNIVREYQGPGGFFGKGKPFRAVDDVSLTIGAGERVGLVGESGCGKSTMLRTILALETPQAGEVLVEGQPFSTARGQALRALRRRIQVVFQDPYGSFDPRYRADKLVAEPLALLDTPLTSRERRDRVMAALESVGLKPEHANRYPHEFSGGQRQRLAIARALVVEPSIIALDEAVSALDVSVRAQILSLLDDLSTRMGLAYLFVSHDLSVVRAVTDRVLVMLKGRIVEAGETEQVFSNPQHPYTAELLAATPLLPLTRKTG